MTPETSRWAAATGTRSSSALFHDIEASMEGLATRTKLETQLSDLEAILRPAGLQIRGTFDLLARFGVERGKLTGALQPLLKNGHVQTVGGDLGNKL